MYSKDTNIWNVQMCIEQIIMLKSAVRTDLLVLGQLGCWSPLLWQDKRDCDAAFPDTLSTPRTDLQKMIPKLAFLHSANYMNLLLIEL